MARTPLNAVLRRLDPDVLALAALASLLHSVLAERGEPDLSIDVGRAVQGELWLLGHDRKERTRIRRSGDPHKAAKAAGYRAQHWTRAQALRVGNFMLDCCLQALPDVFELNRGGETLLAARLAEAGLPQKHVSLTVRVRDESRFVALREQLMWFNPAWVPTTDPPEPWTSWRQRDGNLTAHFVRNVYHPKDERAIQAAFRDRPIQQHVRAVNALQSVAWQINAPVLDALKRHAPTFERRWNRGQEQVKIGRKWINAALLADDIATAEALTGAPFYTRLNIDKRGRVYGLPNFWYGRGDHVRGLFVFLEGMPIGQLDGWLFVHAANCWGEDKGGFPDRFDWTARNYDNLILPTAQQQTDDWLKADHPFQFLAACIEIVAAQEAGPSYITRLPIGFDGSCSGLQHLCAMTRAEEGALVNLRKSDKPQDMYSAVAEGVVADLKAAGDPDGLLTLSIDRKLLKRPVMTWPYNASDFGTNKEIRETLEERGAKIPVSPRITASDLLRPGAPSLYGMLAAIELVMCKPLREKLWQFTLQIREAIERTVPGAAEARKFLSACAQAELQEGRSLTWTTPSGLPWSNRYHQPKTKRVRLVLQGWDTSRVVAEGFEPEIVKDKTLNSAAANFTHACDAAHLALTVNASVAAGITNIASIHDCFACLAPQALEFNIIIREQMQRMYEEHDPLAELKARVPSAPPLPARGPLDLAELPFSYYAYA